MTKNISHIFAFSAFILMPLLLASCNYTTHRTLSKTPVSDTSSTEGPEPDYSITLNDDYQDFVSFMFMGNRSESFGTFFNKFFTANEDYNEALKEYKLTAIATYNRRLDSLNITPPVSQSTKDKLTKVIEGCSKVIQFNKTTKYLDEAVLLIGKSYFLMGEYLQAERKFNEFFSKLTSSSLYDEALVYLGKTKYKLGKTQEGELILKNLLRTTTNNEIKSEIYQTLSNFALSQKNFSDAHSNLENAIEFSKDKESKAELQYILAKIYTISDPPKAPEQYRNAFKNTSDFDLEFYAKLNEAKALNIIKNHREAFVLLTNINKKYIDYPDYKQLIELEIANTYFDLKEVKTAKTDYFNVIVKYPGSKAAADAYYHLAEHYEKDKSDYLKALISYKKVNETNSTSDYSPLSKIKTDVFDKYFTLKAIINDTTKIVIPAEEPELEKFKKQYELEKNPNNKKETIPNKEQQNNPKGGGIGNSDFDTLPFAKDSVIIKDSIVKPVDSNPVIKDTLAKLSDTSKKQLNDSLKSGLNDTIKVPVVNLDSIKGAKDYVKLNAYFELAELFYYNLNQYDSTIHYLDIIIKNYTNEGFVSKALFYTGYVYLHINDSVKAKEYFEQVIQLFPKTLFSNEARIMLGIEKKEISESSINWDSASNDVRLAQNLIEGNDTQKTLIAYKNILDRYPQSLYMPKVLFTTGWIYENYYQNKDSASIYYRILKVNHPNSEYAMAIADKLAYWESLAIKDSLSRKDSAGLQIKDSLGNNISDTTLIARDSLIMKSDSLKTKVLPEEKKIPDNTGDDGSGKQKPDLQPPPKKDKDPKK